METMKQKAVTLNERLMKISENALDKLKEIAEAFFSGDEKKQDP